MAVIAFAVGDGDALLIRAPSGKAVLIDGGSRGQPEVGDRLLGFAFEQPDRADRDRIIAEAKRLLAAYLFGP